MLLNAFLLTYVWNFVILSSGRSREIRTSFSFSLLCICVAALSPSTEQVVPILLLGFTLKVPSKRFTTQVSCDLEIDHVVLMRRSPS